MDGYSISQVTEHSGFPASTLRFYEKVGLVQPARTSAGYRSYDDGHIELLAFIGRAKGLGLSLDEISDLLPLLDDARCGPVQSRLRDLIDVKISEAQERVAELIAFTAELQRVAATLAHNTPDGPCDETCGCKTDQAPAPTTGGFLTPAAVGSDDAPLVCTLSSDRVGGRVAEWQAALAKATSREPIDGGVRARFPAGSDIAALASLAAAEQDCCGFFTFGLTIDGDGVTLAITGPSDSQPVINALVGT